MDNHPQTDQQNQHSSSIGAPGSKAPSHSLTHPEDSEKRPSLQVPELLLQGSSNICDQDSPRFCGSPGARGNSPRTGRHPKYRGIRTRSGKWVSEIREPRKTTRIWLGTYTTPEMAAAAYDVAAIALKAPENAALNFPEMAVSYPIPASTSAPDIRAAAAAAAAMKATTPEFLPSSDLGVSSSSAATSGPEGKQWEFVDMEELLDMPNLLVDMAEGMMVSPPRISSPPYSGGSPPNPQAESLWKWN